MWIILAVCSSGLALADAIGWPDEDPCPPGSHHTASHAYSYCMLSDLESLDCATGEEPGEVHVCAEVTTHSCNSGRMPDEEPCSFEALEIFSACDGDSDCERGTCQPSVACLTETSEDRDEDDDQDRDKDDDDDRDKDDDDDKKRSDKSDCGCQASRAQMGTMALFLGLFGVGLLHRRS